MADTAKVVKNSGRGSKPGERRGGRTKGTPNKVGQTLREKAREYTDEALKVLANIALHGESEAARVSAANHLLDRGYGKPSTVLSGDEDGGAIQLAHQINLVGVRARADS
jgi:hypothetical protein